MRVNIYNCSTATHLPLPANVPKNTDWLIVQNHNIIQLCNWLPYLNYLYFLNVNKNNIQTICESFTANLHLSKVKWLDLSDNRLTKLPKTMQSLTSLQKLWMSGNPLHCDCSMTWMIKWLHNFTSSTGEHVVLDYQNVTCRSGKMIGKPIHLLNEVEMECFPSEMTLWGKVGVAIGTAAIVMLVIAIVCAKEHEK